LDRRLAPGPVFRRNCLDGPTDRIMRVDGPIQRYTRGTSPCTENSAARQLRPDSAGRQLLRTANALGPHVRERPLARSGVKRWPAQLGRLPGPTAGRQGRTRRGSIHHRPHRHWLKRRPTDTGRKVAWVAWLGRPVIVRRLKEREGTSSRPTGQAPAEGGELGSGHGGPAARSPNLRSCGAGR